MFILCKAESRLTGHFVKSWWKRFSANKRLSLLFGAKVELWDIILLCYI